MSERMIFCFGEGVFSQGAGYQKNLQIFNKPVTQDVFKSALSALKEKDFKLSFTKIIDGDLDILTYKEAWKEMWKGMSLDDRKFFGTLPNFDKTIFKSITGIEYDVAQSFSGKEIEVKLDGVTYKAIIK